MSTSTPTFLVGTAISGYQNSGGEDTNWSEFELKRTGNGQPTIKGGVSCGNGANFWELYEEDIERAASLKLNSFRLSIEWNRIEPERGEIDEAGIARYHQIFDCLHRCYLRATLSPLLLADVSCSETHLDLVFKLELTSCIVLLPF